ncbi:4-hydroxythreonine-4-phosphate dehydrogenase PdxA [Clostridium tyrobutyricum]|jgi:4-hydroxythreonine-4-phosphate dehydrogenase|uniref:Putative D-threonate 4-phosphate dehydrogenase n=1 Tax=Clostridium tyrobutyricum DIVETGP TaxID=1408889 RepID=W6N6M4_CLOTY|nr:4-hydroxythreonine-4-phosphate dehydrogenase PdxA [Clostridium tyrobutyricum]AND84896.1 4-hydroxythreonine-4-phosphate dehydrogenase [Clostridium tyrobutyricum]ANP69470.1 4-hydroxythreonine-4-phosphate dehydrogenase PdxA [Clostridium tyrobutyricum]MBR9649073.1 4-hydroxythreonine-4-phosphate dehydrogenase PdxA [Clostridium tyrobutyricum]MBV4416604.1 4-hydroxythreonine-4-phosphate dehydrogenase PdxA [Clostridium tyrobutyricum]MBV4422671.1 4-hydroxythreonine-4-phosphate dehydrogenase PdxA [Clo
MNKPIIAITLGDPAGVGPEIVVKALKNKEIYYQCKPLVIGDYEVLRKALEITKSSLKLNVVSKPDEGKYTLGTIDYINLNNIDISKLEYGKVQAQCGQAAFDYLSYAIKLALDKKVTAIATTPLNKESFKAAGVPYIGHTEVLEKLTNTPDPLTMFEVRGLKVFFYSRHVPLRKACELITKEGIEKFIVRCEKALKVLGIEKPHMAIAGLNPHSGEHGLFGDEEVKYIFPAVKNLQERGVDINGPIGADSVFYQALNGKYDAVLSLYHDQGHIATKMVDFERTISLTNNMPFLRTSVDHGTAFDIAGTGKASDVSMVESILLAAKYGPGFLI